MKLMKSLIRKSVAAKIILLFIVLLIPLFFVAIWSAAKSANSILLSDRKSAESRITSYNVCYTKLLRFMPLDQFKTVYWPGLKALIDGLVAADLTPVVYCEGSYNEQRMEILRDVEKGKVIS